MPLAERNYAVGDQKMLAIVMSCRHRRLYLKGARHPVEVQTDHHNLSMFMTTKTLTSQQARLWETLSGYNLNIVDRAGKKTPTDAPSRQPDYAKAPEGPEWTLEDLCAATILTEQGNAIFCLR